MRSESHFHSTYLRTQFLGRIKWIRSLKHRINDLLAEILQHPSFDSLPATAELSKKNNIALSALTAYEEEIIQTWNHYNVGFADFKVF